MKEFYQNNKRGFLMLGVLIVLIGVWIFTKPKPKTISHPTPVPVEEILPPAPREEVVEVKADIPTPPVQNQPSFSNQTETTLQIQPTNSSPQSTFHTSQLVSKSSVQNLLVSDISKYFTGKIDPYKPLVMPKREGREKGISNTDIGELPWPAEEDEISPRPKPLRLCGIILDKKPVAIVSSERGDFIVRVGDSFLGYKVEDILLNQIILKKGNTQEVLKIE